MRYVPDHVVERWTGRTRDHCVVIPVINEGERIGRLLQRISALGIADLADIVIVDGGSTDGSLAAERLDANRVAGLIRKTGPGKLSAQLLCAYAFALDQGYVGVVTIDGNDKDDPDAIPAFVQTLKDGYDFVQASRYVPGGVGENTPWLRDLAIRLIHAPALSLASGFRWTDTTQGFRAYSRRLLDDPRMAIFRAEFRDYELLAYMNYRAPRLGFRCIELPTARRYPKGEKAPTKIRPFRGEFALLKTLSDVCRGRFNPAGASHGAAAPAFGSLDQARAWYEAWLRTEALPLWGAAGFDADNGGFREALTLQGEPHEPRRRTRSVARQVFVFATAAAEGFDGPCLALAVRGFDFLAARGRRPDGLFVSAFSPEGEVRDDTGHLYEHAFVMLAASALHRAQPDNPRWREEGEALRRALSVLRHEAGGYREVGDQPFQANANMHVFEAALAWEAATGDLAWAALADEVAELALTRFIDPESGVLREFFDAEWTAVEGRAGLIEPGHQFEWAWLLRRWGHLRNDPRGATTARRLYEVGRRGVDPAREVAVNALWDDLSIRDGVARLWPQTERLKAALILGEAADALSAARGLSRYLQTPAAGAWRDKMRPDGTFVDEPAPATSFYHLVGGILALIAHRP